MVDLLIHIAFLLNFLIYLNFSFRENSTTSFQVLKMLNSNTENPYLIWDNGTRNELLEFVEFHRTSSSNTVGFLVVELFKFDFI